MARRRSSTVSRWDVAVSARIAAAKLPSVLERGLPLLTRAADKSRLWMAISAALVATGDTRKRRAAVRGMGSIAVASLLANQVGKRAVPRRRPLLRDVPTARIAHRVPTSSSFPSGHSASAAAFAVGVATECPALAAPIGALAGAVCFSRIFTGVHFTSDVLAGAALGATVAGIGAAAVPAHHREPMRADARPARPQPPRPSGHGLVAVVSLLSGGGGNAGVAEALRTSLPAAEVVELSEDADVADVMKAAAARAEVLGVAGGDGTVNAAATAALDADVPLLVLPAGTFNHFAKDLELTDVEDAFEALAAGRAVCIDPGALGAPAGQAAGRGVGDRSGAAKMPATGRRGRRGAAPAGHDLHRQRLLLTARFRAEVARPVGLRSAGCAAGRLRSARLAVAAAAGRAHRRPVPQLSVPRDAQAEPHGHHLRAARLPGPGRRGDRRAEQGELFGAATSTHRLPRRHRTTAILPITPLGAGAAA
jgi:membrane-associated phospholipid phosphatase